MRANRTHGVLLQGASSNGQSVFMLHSHQGKL